jgi:multiple sugar transport system permease protein
MWGILFASPFLLGFVLFTAAPVVASLLLSLFRYSGMDKPAWVGLANFTTALTKDTFFYPSWLRTLQYAVLRLPLAIIAPLGLALLINYRSWGTTVFRALYYAPSLTPVVAAATLWTWILGQRQGILNAVLYAVFGIEGPAWLGDPSWAIPALLLIGLWGGAGGNSMLIFLAGLQGVPQELYEAAEIDGAGRWARFRHVTLPMITPTIFFLSVLDIIHIMKAFDAVFNLTKGGPAYATYFIALHIYNTAFRSFDLGYASALSWLLLGFTLLLTLIQFRLQNRWVFYAGGGGGS